MPCTYEPSFEELEQERIRLNTITRLACRYCRELERSGRPIPPWAQEFWKEHKKRDTERRSEERQYAIEKKLKKQALKKLSRAERKALGV